MKLLLCRECQTIISPPKAVPGEQTPPKSCPCKQTAGIYTGNKNELAVFGPCTILAVDDEEWERWRTDFAYMATVYIVKRSATTILDLDKMSFGDPV